MDDAKLDDAGISLKNFLFHIHNSIPRDLELACENNNGTNTFKNSTHSRLRFVCIFFPLENGNQARRPMTPYFI